jgi:hypothetical protein
MRRRYEDMPLRGWACSSPACDACMAFDFEAGKQLGDGWVWYLRP